MNNENMHADELAQVQTSVSMESISAPTQTEVVSIDTPSTTNPTRPNYWPEDLWDANTGSPKLQEASTRLQEANKRIDGFRKTLAEKEAAAKPKAPEKYSYEQGEEYESLPQDDKEVLGIFSEISRKNGLTDDQAINFLNEYQERMISRQQEYVKSREASLGEHGKQLIEGLDLWAQTRVNYGTFSEAEANSFRNLARQDINLATAMAKTISQTGEKLIPTSVQAQTMQQTKADIKFAMQEVLKNNQLSSAQKNNELGKLRAKLQEVL